MADITLDGKDLTFDLEQLTITEYRKFASGGMLDDQDDELLARVVGEPVEWVRGLSQPNYRRLLRAFFKKASEPLTDPN